MKSLILVGCSLLGSALLLSAQEPAPLFGGAPSFTGPAKGKVEVTVELLADVTAIAPGQPFTAALHFKHNPEWHTYWINSGYVEQAPSVTWNLPTGFVAGPLEFPIPEHAEHEGRASYYYTDSSYLLTTITPPRELAVGEIVNLEAQIKYQYCKDVCIPAKETKSLNLPVANAASPQPENAALLANYRKAHFPMAMPTGWSASATRFGSKITLTVEGKEITAPDAKFYPASDHIRSQPGYPLSASAGKLAFTLPLDPDKDGALSTLSGLLVISTTDAKMAYQIQAPITMGAATSGEAGGMTLSYTLLLAFIGGLILNLMPCVFPVIGLKIMGFVRQAGQDRRKILLHGLMFSAGVLVCFWALSGTLLWLRSRGEQVGWGFQLQSPWVVYGLMVLMFVFALNMFGVFEIGTSAVGVGQELTAKQGLSGTFFSGLLAVVVATPCSAPFLAPALGATLTLAPVAFFSVFTTIGIGLALPYLLLSAFPGLLKKLPKPGAWMEAFKQIMSFLLFMTAGYLLWVYGGLTAPTNESNQLFAILGLGLIGLGAYIYGRWCPPVHAGKTRAIGGVLAVAFAATGFWLGVPKKDTLQWEPWSEERVAELRAEGIPVYIDFTAKWCATCQTNKISYKSKEIVALAEAKKIVLLKADWTDRNDKITEALAGYERSAIPVNVLYIPGQDEPEILPNILTTNTVLDYWKKIPAAK